MDAFYRHAMMADGLLGKCKECTKSDVRTHRDHNLERFREYDRRRAKLPHRVNARRVYAKSDAGRRSHAEALRRQIRKNPQKYKARVALNNAIRNRRITKTPCAVCGSKNVQGHHQDYSKPLEVVWLCIKHHREEHKRVAV